MKNKLLILSIIISFILIVILHYICLSQNVNIGNFKREFKQIKFLETKEINFTINLDGFIDVDEKNIILSSNELTNVMSFNIKNKKTKRVHLDSHIMSSNIINDTLYLFDSTLNLLTRMTKNLKRIDTIKLKSRFDRAIALSSNKILIRESINKYSQTVLSLYDLKKKKSVKFNHQFADSLEIDGGIKTDGRFILEDSSLVFIQMHKGNFYKINTRTNKLNHFKTLDNTQVVDGVKMAKDSSFSINKPLLTINNYAHIEGENLYVVSNVLTKNDNFLKYRKFVTIDVYNHKNGNYLYSFHLPNNKKQKPLDFIIKNNKLYLVFEKKIKIYEITK